MSLNFSLRFEIGLLNHALKIVCPLGEIGKHSGLKIRSLRACQFKSGRGHHFISNGSFALFLKMKCVVFAVVGKIISQNAGCEQEISFHCAVHPI